MKINKYHMLIHSTDTNLSTEFRLIELEGPIDTGGDKK
jgi:hypothetical protein